jgi:CubicO group peptidase (beta-lactamase class C family)
MAARSRPGGEPARADLTFSVAKTYLGLLAGVAQGQGLLPDEDEPVAARLPGTGFDDSERNRAVTWAQLLSQTSEWEGTSFGLPTRSTAGARWRRTRAPRPGPQGRRPSAAGAGQLLGIQRRAHQPARARPAASLPPPLPEVFLEQLLRPLGGGDGFAWRGYDDAWVELSGVGRVQSVPGGTHWGRGVSISAATRRASASSCSTAARRRPAADPGDWIAKMKRRRRSRRSTAGCSG